MSDSCPVIMTELELDALTELVNLGVSNAATSLREMVREEVLLSVPKVAIVTRAEAISNLGDRQARHFVAVHQDFEGDIRGRALLIFPEAKSMELVRAVVGGDLPVEELVELEQEALAETGNVILNSCLGTIANNLERSLHITLPEVVHGDGAQFFSLSPRPEAGDSVLFIYINFSIRRGDIRGYLALVLDLPSLAVLKSLLGSFIDRNGGTTTTALHAI
ncbi:MAG: chemotaxis protein CheX [Steroidobacteraceae bacterium]